jgi:hypothetical protein
VKRTFNDGRVDMLDPAPEQSLGARLVTGGLAPRDENAPAPDFTDEAVTVPDDEAAAAQKAMEGENTKLADATRAYYTDQLGRQYTKAERETRFKLARQGLLGGSEDVFQQGEVNSDRDLGATRVDEAVRHAVASLKTQREQERLNAINLVNSGAGDSAVSAAQAGLRTPSTTRRRRRRRTSSATSSPTAPTRWPVAI